MSAATINENSTVTGLIPPAFIAHNTPIPEEQFSCPTADDGVNFATIPWASMNQTLIYPNISDAENPYTTQFCGIKGPHPRMEYCCRYGDDKRATFDRKYYNITTALSGGDNCSQWCNFWPGDIDLWLYCMTAEDHTVQNAFCYGLGGQYSTTGTLPRTGPYNMSNYNIQDKIYYTHLDGAGSVLQARSHVKWACLAFFVSAILL